MGGVHHHFTVSVRCVHRISLVGKRARRFRGPRASGDHEIRPPFKWVAVYFGAWILAGFIVPSAVHAQTLYERAARPHTGRSESLVHYRSWCARGVEARS
jgi:hypothetical protein